MMDRLIQILSFSCLIILVCTFELEPDFSSDVDLHNRVYDINDLVRKSLSNFQNSYTFESQPEHLQFESPFNNLIPEDLKFYSDNYTKCFHDLIYVAENLKNASDQWAIKMLDSYGKPDSGILEGSVKWFGEYTECIQVYAPAKHNSTTGNFHGQYCLLAWSIDISNFSLALSSGICLPDTCSASEVKQGAKKFLHPIVDFLKLNGTVNVTSFTCKPTEKKLNAAAKVVIFLLSLFFALVILGSSVTAVKYFMESASASSGSPLIVNIPHSDWVGNQNGPLKKNAESDDELLLEHDSQTNSYDFLKKMKPFLECFCLFKNGAKLLNTTGGEGELLCIHGIRFLSMSWVILGHVYAFSFSFAKNMVETVGLVDNFAFQIVLQGFFSVDSFFVLSGFLLTYLFLREFAKNKEGMSWAYFYIHRYLRLTPVYMIVLGFSSTVFLYLGAGPLWPDNDVDPICRDSWWWNLLYINNFKGMSDQCMAWSWYLANDMQFFVISPIFLITLARWPKVGYSLVAIFLFACWLCNFFITYHYDLMPGVVTLLSLPRSEMLSITLKLADYMDKLYIKPYTRIAPYLIGMVTGHILFTRKQTNKPKHDWSTLSIGWIVASIITLVCVYGLYHTDPSLIARSFYNTLNRTIFAIGLSWVIYVCLVEQGGFVNSILSFKMFIPLSRLTYSAYLIHPLIITFYYSSLKTALYFSHPTMVTVHLGVMVATYALSLPVALVFESPIIALEKLIRKSFAKKKDECKQ